MANKYAFSFLICNLRNDFEGASKVVQQTRIFFRLEKSGSAKSDFFSGWRRVVLQIRIFFLVGDQEKNPSLQNHFTATLEFTSKGAGQKAVTKNSKEAPD